MYSPPCFTSPWHPEASPKLLVKKQAAVWWIKQQPLPSLPSRLPALIFQSLSVPALCLFYALLGKWIFSCGPLSSPHSPSITLLPPPPPPPSSTSPSCPMSLSSICSRLPSPKDWLVVKLAVFRAKGERCICHCNYCQPCGQKTRLAFSHLMWVCLNVRQ